jgi:hypothetical protein
MSEQGIEINFAEVNCNARQIEKIKDFFIFAHKLL